MSRFEDNDTDGLFLVPEVFEERDQPTLWVVETEGDHLTGLLVLYLVSDIECEFRIFPESYLHDFEGDERTQLLCVIGILVVVLV